MSVGSGVRPRRTAFLTRALNYVGTPYLWRGKNRDGLDCSGLVTLALRECGGPDWRRTHWTDRLWRELPALVEPRLGDLAFYGGTAADDVDHVVVCVGHGIVVGACGGDSSTLTAEAAMARNARVKVKEFVAYRTDFRGYRSMTGFLQ